MYDIVSKRKGHFNKALTKEKEKVYKSEKKRKKNDKVYEKIAQGRGNFERKLNEQLGPRWAN